MASFATATRLTARIAGRRVAQDASARGFRTSAASLAAQNFTMPALSPTMTEGNIASWKVKEGDKFAAGDVLLEIETDKASMDVEAQEDGIVMKITETDGAKGVQVGTRIGVLAEPDDDISTLEMPAEEKTAQTPAKEEAAPAPSQQSSGSSSSAPKQPKKSGEKAPPQKYPLYPSVAHLIKENKLDDAAISDMTPTGPQGRLLKGDVLAYLGKVSQDRPEQIMSRFNHNSHLDLSNIKIAAPKEAPKPTGKAAPEVPIIEDLLVSLPVSLSAVIEVQNKIQATLGTFMPLSTFVARATEVANDELPLPSNYKPTADELFNQVLGLDKVGPKGSQGIYVPQITALPSASLTGTAPMPKPAKKVDIFDILTSAPKKAAKPSPISSPSSVSTKGPNVFSLTVPPTEEKRAKAFLQRVKVVLENEPGRLVL